MGMVYRLGENTLNDAFCEFARALILFLDHTNLHSGPNIGSVLSVHFDI